MTKLYSSILLLICAALASCIRGDIENPSEYEISSKTKHILKRSGGFPGYNHEYKTRDTILGVSNLWKEDGQDSLWKFSGLTIRKLDMLFAGQFIDPDYTYKNAPTPREFFDFMIANPQLTAHGFAVSPYRPDYGVVLSGLDDGDSLTVTPALKDSFRKFCEGADSLYIESILYSHWE